MLYCLPQLLRCLSTSPAGDKLAYEIGFTEQPDKRKLLCSLLHCSLPQG